MSSMSSQFEDERRLTFIIARNHRDAFIAEQIRLAQAGQSRPIALVWARLRASIGTRFHAARSRIRRHPITSPEFAADPVSLQELNAESVNPPVIA